MGGSIGCLKKGSTRGQPIQGQTVPDSRPPPTNNIPPRRVSIDPIEPSQQQQQQQQQRHSTASLPSHSTPRPTLTVDTTTTPSAFLDRLEHTPVAASDKTEYKFFCPLCMCYLKALYSSSCCKNYTCHECAVDYLTARHIPVAASTVPSRVLSVSCPHCATSEFAFSRVDPSVTPRRYADSPVPNDPHNNNNNTSTNNHHTNAIAQSPLRPGDSADVLQRKLIRFSAVMSTTDTDTDTDTAVVNAAPGAGETDLHAAMRVLDVSGDEDGLTESEDEEEEEEDEAVARIVPMSGPRSSTALTETVAALTAAQFSSESKEHLSESFSDQPDVVAEVAEVAEEKAAEAFVVSEPVLMTAEPPEPMTPSGDAQSPVVPMSTTSTEPYAMSTASPSPDVRYLPASALRRVSPVCLFQEDGVEESKSDPAAVAVAAVATVVPPGDGPSSPTVQVTSEAAADTVAHILDQVSSRLDGPSSSSSSSSAPRHVITGVIPPEDGEDDEDEDLVLSRLDHSVSAINLSAADVMLV